MSTETVQVQDLRAGDRVLDVEGVPAEVIGVRVIGFWVEVDHAPEAGGVAQMEDTATYLRGGTVERVVA